MMQGEDTGEGGTGNYGTQSQTIVITSQSAQTTYYLHRQTQGFACLCESRFIFCPLPAVEAPWRREGTRKPDSGLPAQVCLEKTLPKSSGTYTACPTPVLLVLYRREGGELGSSINYRNR